MANSPVKRSRHRWSLQDGRSGHLTLTWQISHGRLGCVGLSLTSDDGRAIDVRDLRMMRLGEQFDEGRDRVAEELLKRSELANFDNPSLWREFMKVTPQERVGKPGRRPLADDHYERVAETYRALLKISRSPTQDLANHYGVSHPTAARWIGRTRKLGLLPKTSPGRVSPADEAP